MKCKCPSENHGHKAGKCKNLATEPDHMCKQCHDKAVKEIHDLGSARRTGPKRAMKEA